MWKSKNREQFAEIIEDLLQDPDVLLMKELPQHSKHASTFDHSVYVAYLSFLICRRLKLDYVAAARGGMLHDFALRNWDTEDYGVRRLWHHPHMALENAKERYELSPKEEDIIVKHMWPLTRPLPRHKESFVVSMADKMCALMEMSRLYRLMKVKKHLVPVPAMA